MTRALREFVTALDWACWENAEEGGDGWVPAEAVAEEYGVTVPWARVRCEHLVRLGMAERRHTRWVEGGLKGEPVTEYAPTEAGAALANGGG